MFDRPIPPTRLKIAQFLLGIGLLGIVTELVTGQHWILPGSVMAAVGGALLGLTRWVCPRCGLKQTSICTAQQLCSVCGVPAAKESAPPDWPAEHRLASSWHTVSACLSGMRTAAADVVFPLESGHNPPWIRCRWCLGAVLRFTPRIGVPYSHGQNRQRQGPRLSGPLCSQGRRASFADGVQRSFLQPGRRLKLHPDDYYALGTHRGGIDERWFASTTEAAIEGRAADEGLSYVVAGNEKFLLRDAVAELGAEMVGAYILKKYKKWPVYSKFFDNMGPIPHYMHQNAKQRKK